MKIRLTRELAQKRYDDEAIRDLYHFMDWVMKLPPLETLQYKDELSKMEDESVKYISTIEQMAFEKASSKAKSH